MPKRDAKTKTPNEEGVSKENAGSATEVSNTATANANMTEDGTTASLVMVLEELRDFRKDFQDFKSDLSIVHQKITKAETRIDNVEDRVQNVEQVLANMLKVMREQENKILDQESRSRRRNLRVYNVREGAENGSPMLDFMAKLLRDTLDIPLTTSLDIERAHRALGPKPPVNEETKTRSIVMAFARFTTKEEVLRKAWSKKTVIWEGKRIYFDQDYPPAILQKRKEYAEAKKVLKRHNVRFQTPYPHNLRVFYENGTRLYHSAEEATKDMIARGLPVTKVTTKESLAQQLARSAWTAVGVQQRRDDGDAREQVIREKLQIYRRLSSPITED